MSFNIASCYHRVREWARNQPFIFERIAPSKERFPYRRRVVRRGDDIVIEGYPRSANTYATEAFIHAQKRDVLVGNHFHSSAQFFLARRFKVPAILVLRPPADSVLSLLVFDPDATAIDLANRYLSFHSPLLKIRDSFVVAPFKEITSDFSKCIIRVNRRFGTDFRHLPPDKQLEAEIYDRVNRKQAIIDEAENSSSTHKTTIPSRQKELLKEMRLDELKDPKVIKALDSGHRLYQELTREIDN